MNDWKDRESDPNYKKPEVQKFSGNLWDVVCSQRFWTVQSVLLIITASAVLINFSFANNSLYESFNYFWFDLGMLCLIVIIVNAMTCASLFKCKNWASFLGYLLMSYFIATLPCSVIEMLAHRNFTAQGFMDTEGGLILLFLTFALITSLFYRYLYDKQTSNFKYPGSQPKTERVSSVISIVISAVCFTLSVLLFGSLYIYSKILDNLEGLDEFMPCESELSYSAGDSKEAEFISEVGNKHPRHNEDISIYVDFSQSSANKRFVVVDNKTNEVLASSNCAHGAGKGSTVDTPVFSNEIGSNCSSLGEYKVGEIGEMTNGFPCIRLDGLSKTNSNVRKRGVVIHELPFFTGPVFEGVKLPLNKYISSGCFAIAPEVFALLTNLRKEGKTMYIYATA